MSTSSTIIQYDCQNKEPVPSAALIGIVLGIDQIVGMMRTVFNVNGDIAATAVIASGRGLLDQEVYYGKDK